MWKLAAGGSSGLTTVAKILCHNLTLNTGASRESPTSSLMWRRGSGIWGESLSGQVKVQWLTLCHSSLRPECRECAGRRHSIHLSQVSPENANYGRILQTLQIPAPKKWKNSDKQNHNIDNIRQNVALNKSEEWNWEDTNQKYWHKTNTSQRNQQIQLYCNPSERWPNRRRRFRRL